MALRLRVDLFYGRFYSLQHCQDAFILALDSSKNLTALVDPKHGESQQTDNCYFKHQAFFGTRFTSRAGSGFALAYAIPANSDFAESDM